jgi:Uma2 family endonuclease
MSLLMRTVRPMYTWTPSESQAVHELENGREMDQPTFHRLYKRTPEGFKAELIGGIVHVMASPVSPRHGRTHFRVCHWLALYIEATPGTDAMDNTTSIMDEDSEPQPDVCLVLLPECGGKARIVEDKSVSGPLDLVVEVANSSRAYDLGSKKRDYERNGVREYVVAIPGEEQVRWFVNGSSGFREVAKEADGMFRSEVFPGLWLDPRGLFAPSIRLLSACVRKGVASPEHAAFVAELKSRLTKQRKRKGK